MYAWEAARRMGNSQSLANAGAALFCLGLFLFLLGVITFVIRCFSKRQKLPAVIFMIASFILALSGFGTCASNLTINVH